MAEVSRQSVGGFRVKVLLIVGGVLFLLLSFALFVAAIVTFFMSRRRPAVPAVPHEPDTQRFERPPSRPPGPPPLPAEEPEAPRPLREKIHPTPRPAPPPPSLEPEVEATVMIDSRKQQLWGALQATKGPLAGRVFPVDPKGAFIGRDATQAQIVIESPSVSKRHVWVGVKDGAVVAIDQKSTNGTYLNTADNAIIEVQLLPGDTIILSDDVARFTYTR